MIVPDLGLGMRPRRPRMRPSLPDHAHHVRRRDRDVELEPAGLDALGEVVAADLVGAGRERFLGLVALGEHDDADVLPVPCGSTTVPRTIWSAWRGSTPRRMWASTDGSNLTVEVSLSRSIASSGS